MKNKIFIKEEIKMKHYEDYMSALLGDSNEAEFNFVKGFVAAMEVFGIDCPIPYDRSGRGSLLDPNLHIWILGQIVAKDCADNDELEAAEDIIVQLYQDKALGTALEDVGRAVLNERGIIDTDKFGSQQQPEIGNQSRGPAILIESEGTNASSGAENKGEGMSGILSEKELQDILGNMSGGEVEPEPEQKVQQNEATAEEASTPYEHLFLYRTSDSKTYHTLEEVQKLPPTARKEYFGYWTMVVSGEDGSVFYDEERNPKEYSVMLKMMKSAAE